MEVPKQLKANRERIGMSQEDVAHAIYVSRQIISSWENGKTYPDVQSLLLLSQLFGVSIDALVKGDVVSMEEKISKDALAIERLSWGAACSLLAGIVCMVVGCQVWPDPSFIPHVSCGALIGIGSFVVLFSVSLFLARRIERIKSKHDLMTYREICAFMEGKERSDINTAFSRKHGWLASMVKLVCGAGVGLVVCFAIACVIDPLL